MMPSERGTCAVDLIMKRVATSGLGFGYTPRS